MTVAEVKYLLAKLTLDSVHIQAERAMAAPGTAQRDRLEVAESAVGWLLGALQNEVRDRLEEFEADLAEGEARDVDQELRELLGGDSP